MDRKIEQFFEEVKTCMAATFATGCNGSITMRVVSPVVFGEKLLIFTDADSIKYRQLKENPHCCLNIGSFFAEADAEFFGATTLPKNEELRNAYCVRYPDAFTEGVEYGGLNAEFIVLTLKRLSGWGYANEIMTDDGVPNEPFEIIF